MRKPFALVIYLLVASLLVVFTARFYEYAFPQLTPGPALKRTDIPQAGAKFARRLGFDASEYLRAMVFDVDDQAKYFLELDYGISRLEDEVRRGVRIWDWSLRYFRPGEQEEINLRLSPIGSLIGFSHTVAETAQYPRLETDRAQRVAELFLADMVSQHPIERLELTETSVQERPGHLVHSFTWQRTDWQWGDGRYHLHVSVRGDQISRYREHLDVPEVWQRDFDQRRSENDVYQSVAQSGLIVLALGIVFMFVNMARRHEVHWHGFPYLWSIPVALVLLLGEFSDFPRILFSYQTKDDFASYLVRESIDLLFSAFTDALLLVILAFVADAFWQRSFPQRTPIRALLGGAGLATQESLRAVPYAFVLALLTLAYVTTYYLVGRNVGIWTPSTVDYSRVLTGYFPAIEALSDGVSAALGEELVFRVLSVVFIFRLTGSRWLSIFVSAVVWGFLHSNYPQLPGYARGIELTLEGIVLGWVALRFGILTTLLSHCLYNTWLGALYAWQTGAAGHMGMAVVVSLWPAGLWLKGWLDARRLGRSPRPEELASGAVPLRQQLVSADAILRVQASAIDRTRWLAMAALTLVVLGVITILPRLPLDDLGAIGVTRSQAESLADGILKSETGADPNAYRRVAEHDAYLVSVEWEYLLEHLSAPALTPLLRRTLYEDYWRVQYFRPQELETYAVYLDPDGGRTFIHRSIPETAPGAEIDFEDAVQIAGEHLAALFGLGADEYRYVSHNISQRKARRDYRVTFESTRWAVGDSKLRWQVFLLGDHFNGYQRYVKVPEAYERARSAQGWREIVADLLSYATVLALAVGVLLVNGLLIMHHCVPWRDCFKLAAAMAVLALINELNLIPQFFDGYRTIQSLGNYAGIKVIEIALRIAVVYAYAVLLFAAVIGLVRWLTGQSSRSALLGADAREMWARWLQGLGLGAFGLTLVSALQYAARYINLFVTEQGMLDITVPVLNGLSPALDVISSGLTDALQTALVHGVILLSIILLWDRHRRLLIVLLLILLLDYNVEWDTWQDVAVGISLQLAAYALLFWLYARVFRFNAFAYIFLFYLQALLPAAWAMTEKAWPAYSADVILLWLATAAPLVAGLAGWRLARAHGDVRIQATV